MQMNESTDVDNGARKVNEKVVETLDTNYTSYVFHGSNMFVNCERGVNFFFALFILLVSEPTK